MSHFGLSTNIDLGLGKLLNIISDSQPWGEKKEKEILFQRNSFSREERDTLKCTESQKATVESLLK